MSAFAAEGLGPWVRQWRHNHRWTQERLAEELGYDVSYIAKIERGRRRPTRQFIARLAAVLEVGQQQLLQISRQPSARLRLPASAGQIAGRDREIEEVGEMLRGSARCVTLVGAPGIGKTTLALEVAWRLADDYRHGACFVGLADVSVPESVAPALVHSLGLLERGSVDLDELLFQALRHRELLLVLDNFEHVLAASSLVERLIESVPKLRVLATSREALGVHGETQYPVRALGFPDPTRAVPDDAHEYPAVKVFVQRSQMVRDDFVLDAGNVESVVDICARLAGLPLAIALTARASRILSPADIARSLRNRLELGTDGAAEPLAHARLRSALDWSWALLPAGHRALLASLGVFSGGCALAAVEEICADGVDDVLQALAALERQSLIEVAQVTDGSSRFVCLEPIRRYALEKLGELGLVEGFRARHCAYFVAFAETAESGMTARVDQAQTQEMLEADHANLAVAFEWALENDPESALRLGAALWRFCSMRRISEGRRWLGAALERAAGTPLLRARSLNGFGFLARLQGDLKVAEAAVERASALAAECGATQELAFATLTQGIVAEDQALYDLAEARFTEATEIYRAIGDERGTGHGLNCLGVIALRRGDTPAASAQFHEALGRFRLLNDRWSVAVTATNLGWIAEMAGELGEARDWYEESRQIWDHGDEHGRARSLAALGRVARRQRNFPEARTLLESALGIFYRLGHRRLAAACLIELSDIAYERKRCDVAARLLGAAESLRVSLGTPAWPDEEALEAHVVSGLHQEMGVAATDRTYAMGKALTLEDAVDMVRADAWPPTKPRGRGFPSDLDRSGRAPGP